jgi:hypothetical protein
MNLSAAAFDTRRSGPAFLTGRASRALRRELVGKGAQIVAAPRSFLVSKENDLLPGELDQARDWGQRLLDQG